MTEKTRIKITIWISIFIFWIAIHQIYAFQDSASITFCILYPFFLISAIKQLNLCK